MNSITWTNTSVKLGDLKPWADNPKLSTKAQAKRILDSWQKFGQVMTVAVSPTLDVYDGHQRLSVLLTLYGADYVVDARQASRHLSDEERRAMVLALTNATGSWNWDSLAGWKAEELQGWGFDKDTLKGWNNDANNLKEMLKAQEPETADAPAQVDRAAELLEKWGVVTGDMFAIGEHRLICGDCTDAAVVARVMGGERAAVCLTDPPYGLGDKKKSGKNDYNEYKDTRENLEKLAAGWLPIARELCDVVVFSPGVTNAWIYPEANWIMCWFYAGGQLRSSWGFNCWQPLLCYGKDPSLAAGKGARPDAVEMNVPANAEDVDHPCPKPLKLWEWLIERLSFGESDIFFEPFSGSGTTLVACQNLGRRGRGIEISPAYVAVTLERMATAFPDLDIKRA